MSHIVIVESDDWVGFYKDGHLVDQTHRFETQRLLDLLGIKDVKVRWIGEQAGWIIFPKFNNHFPSKLSELDDAMPKEIPFNEEVKLFQLKEDGKPFHCYCGGNVFRKKEPYNTIYVCNACGTEAIGTGFNK